MTEKWRKGRVEGAKLESKMSEITERGEKGDMEKRGLKEEETISVARQRVGSLVPSR